MHASTAAQVIDDLHRFMSILSSKSLFQTIIVSGSEQNWGNIWLAALLRLLTRTQRAQSTEKTNASETSFQYRKALSNPYCA
ncbi:MAG: hypothetical protein AAFN80_14635 [Pseudomonadota bacterium]